MTPTPIRSIIYHFHRTGAIIERLGGLHPGVRNFCAAACLSCCSPHDAPLAAMVVTLRLAVATRAGANARRALRVGRQTPERGMTAAIFASYVKARKGTWSR